MAYEMTMSENVLDKDAALAHVDGDTELLSELAAMFVQDYPRLVGEARQGIRQADSALLERAAHTLKGRLAFFGITMLRDALIDLEAMGRERQLSRASQLLTHIEAAMEPILQEFEILTREQGR
jgi:HPt (histidine-containing phosphotransfer) domain-containing protein